MRAGESDLGLLEGLWERFERERIESPDLNVEQFASKNPLDRELILNCLPGLKSLHDAFESDTAVVGFPTHVDGYEIHKLLGIGGMGAVYLASRDGEAETVAIKVLNLSTASEAHLKRFQRECAIAFQLRHQNIVPVLECRADTEIPYYVMRYIDGPNLAEVIDWGEDRHKLTREQTLHEQRMSKICDRLEQNWRSIAEVGGAVAAALAHAHSRGVLHRDVKPSNILIDVNLNVWVTDFGVSKQQDASSLTSRLPLGTPQYMAPEQMRGTADARSDVFGIGLVLYELAVMRRMGAKEIKVSRDGGLTQPSELSPSIPDQLEAIIKRSLELNSSDRFQSAEELRNALRDFVLDRPTVTAKNTYVWPIGLAIPLVLSAILLLSVLGLYWFKRSPPSPWVAPSVSELLIDENESTIGRIKHFRSKSQSFLYALVDSPDRDACIVDSENGVLSFVECPDFETPLDADKDNRYELKLRVSDDDSSYVQFDVVVRIRDVDEAPVVLENAFTASKPSDATKLLLSVADDRDTYRNGLYFSVQEGSDSNILGVLPLAGVPMFKVAGRDSLPLDANGDGIYELTGNVCDNVNVKTLYVKYGKAHTLDISTVSTTPMVTEHLDRQDQVIGMATADGVRFYQLEDDGAGSAALWEFAVSPNSSASHGFQLRNADCGLTRETVGLATRDGNSFFVLAKNAGGQPELYQANLDSSGVFHTTLLAQDCGLPKTCCSLSTLDGITFYTRVAISGASDGNSTHEFESRSAFVSAMLCPTGRFAIRPTTEINHTESVDAEAIWLQRGAASQQSPFHLEIEVASARTSE